MVLSSLFNILYTFHKARNNYVTVAAIAFRMTGALKIMMVESLLLKRSNYKK